MSAVSPVLSLLHILSGGLMGGTYLVGIVLAIVAMRRAGRASVFTLVAMVIQLVALVGGLVVPVALVRSASSAADMAVLYAAVNLVFTVMHVLAYGLLFAAIFGRREPGEQPGLGGARFHRPFQTGCP
jgi:hypothetical protein